jgi:hypothetical protein
MQFVRSCHVVRQNTSTIFVKSFSTVTSTEFAYDYPVVDVRLRSMEKSSGSYYCRKLRKGDCR